VSKTPKLVNAWILLSEDDPTVNGQPVGYDDPRSAYQRLIAENVYRAVDMLFLCFATPVPTSSTTVPAGDGDFYTLQINPVDPLHPGGLTNQDYMDYVIRDSRANHPEIKISVTLDYGGNGDQIANIFANSAHTPEENADNFASNLVQYLEHYGLDGFDVDWEHDLSFVTSQDQFRLLFTAIGKQFKQAAKKYYLSLSPAYVENLDADTVNSNFDFVALQLYSGFTTPGEFTDAGVSGDLLAYGAKFEADPGQPAGPSDPGHQTAQDAYDEARGLEYTTYSQWRLNSGIYEFEQDQQLELYRLVYS